MGTEFCDHLIHTAMRKGYLDADRVQVAYSILRAESARGNHPRLREVLVRHNLLTREQLLEVRRTMAREGVHMRLGDFDIIARLGRGAMGSVYRARQRSLDREVAVKILSPYLATDNERVERFFHEARAAAKVHHPNVVRVYDVGHTRHTHYIVMEYVHGATLERILEAEELIDEERSLSIAIQVARALVTIEACGMVHRDIKPGNIIVTPSGVAKLADLGLALMPGEIAEESAGTPFYMSPEQRLRESDLDIRSDIYALGCTLYHAVTGEPPFEGRNVAETLHMHAETPVPDPADLRPTLSSAFCATLRRMMAKKSGQRFQNATELRNSFERCGDGLQVHPTEIPAALRRRISSRMLAVGLAALGLTFAAVIIVMLMMGWL